MSFFKNKMLQNIPNTSMEPITNNTLQTININSLTMINSSQISHHNIFDTKQPMDTILSTNRNIPLEKRTLSMASVYDVNQILSQLKQYEAIIQQQNNKIKQQNDQIEQKDIIIQKKDHTILNERKKKRELIIFVSERGFYNPFIGKSMGTFQYSAEIRKYQISNMKELYIGETEYIIGSQLEGEKTFHFTNSANFGTKLILSQLAIVEAPPKKNEKGNEQFTKRSELKFVQCSFKKDMRYDDNCLNINNCYQKNNKFKSKKKNNDYRYYKCSDVIYPGDYFSVTFKHPIIQKIGEHKCSYRLFSFIKAGTRSKGDAKGMFGQKIEVTYQVKGWKY